MYWHDTHVYLNGNLLGELLDTVPEGTYLWKVNPSFLDPEGFPVRDPGAMAIWRHMD